MDITIEEVGSKGPGMKHLGKDLKALEWENSLKCVSPRTPP